MSFSHAVIGPFSEHLFSFTLARRVSPDHLRRMARIYSLIAWTIASGRQFHAHFSEIVQDR
jgi:hypothetical protein